jgi:hypothetical protein
LLAVLGVGTRGFPMFELTMFELTIAFFVTFGLTAFAAHTIETYLPR